MRRSPVGETRASVGRLNAKAHSTLPERKKTPAAISRGGRIAQYAVDRLQLHVPEVLQVLKVLAQLGQHAVIEFAFDVHVDVAWLLRGR